MRVAAVYYIPADNRGPQEIKTLLEKARDNRKGADYE
jgi:hypothetical protein